MPCPKRRGGSAYPGPLYTLMLKLVGLVLALLAIIFLLQNRIDDCRLDRRRWVDGVGLEPGPPHACRNLAIAGDLLHRRPLCDLRAAYRGRVCLCGARHRAERRRDCCGAASRAFDPQPEPARLCGLAAAQSAISDIGAARQSLCPGPDRAGQRRALYPGRTDRAAGLGNQRLRLARHRSRPADWAATCCRSA